MKPLDGLLVLSLEQAVAAPYCTSRLADAGARVIKVERPEGDFARHYDHSVHGQSANFVWLNRGKESLVANIKDPDDQALLHRMLARADVFVQNLSPGAAGRAGFDQEDLRTTHPRLVTCSISGYGEDGPYRDMKAYDLLIQAESGLCSITGTDGHPSRVGVSVCDIAAGMYAYQGILESLLARAQSGKGRHVSVSMFDGMADWMTVPLLHHDYGDSEPHRLGLFHPFIAPYGVFQTKSRASVLISIQNEREWAKFADIVMNHPEWAASGPFSSGVSRLHNRRDLDNRIAQRFRALTTEELLVLLKQANTAYGMLNDMAGLSAHPALRRTRIETPMGPVDLPAPPTTANPRLGPVPDIGAHSAALRKEFAA